MNRFFPRGIRFGRCNPFPRGRRKLQIPRCSRHPRFVETWKPGKWRNGERWNPRGCKSREWTFTAGMEGEPRIGPIPRFWRQNFPRKCPSLPSKSWKPGKLAPKVPIRRSKRSVPRFSARIPVNWRGIRAPIYPSQFPPFLTVETWNPTGGDPPPASFHRPHRGKGDDRHRDRIA